MRRNSRRQRPSCLGNKSHAPRPAVRGGTAAFLPEKVTPGYGTHCPPSLVMGTRPAASTSGVLLESGRSGSPPGQRLQRQPQAPSSVHTQQWWGRRPPSPKERECGLDLDRPQVPRMCRAGRGGGALGLLMGLWRCLSPASRCFALPLGELGLVHADGDAVRGAVVLGRVQGRGVLSTDPLQPGSSGSCWDGLHFPARRRLPLRPLTPQEPQQTAPNPVHPQSSGGPHRVCTCVRVLWGVDV